MSRISAGKQWKQNAFLTHRVGNLFSIAMPGDGFLLDG
jgi:hypothetical protein